MIDWPTVAYVSVVVVAYLFGRGTKSFESYSDGFDSGMEEGVERTLKKVFDIMDKSGFGKEFRNIMEQENKRMQNEEV